MAPRATKHALSGAGLGVIGLSGVGLGGVVLGGVELGGSERRGGKGRCQAGLHRPVLVCASRRCGLGALSPLGMALAGRMAPGAPRG